MGLLQNRAILNAEPVDYTGATSESWPSQLGWQMNKFVGFADVDKKSGVPEGYAPPYSFQLPIKDGGMSSFAGITGSGTVSYAYGNLARAFPTVTLSGAGYISATSPLTLIVRLYASALTGSGTISNTSTLGAVAMLQALATIVGGGNITTAQLTLLDQYSASLSGSGDIIAEMKSILSIAASITGSGQIDDSNLSMLVQLVSNVSGSGTVSSANMKSILTLTSTLVGSGTIVTSPLKLIAWCTAAVTGQGNLAATMKGFLSMASTITSAGEIVTAESCAAAVWSALAAANNRPDSMGEQLNNVGAGANPWTAPIEGTYTAEDIMKILLAVLAGKTTITDLGGGNATVTFRDINDTANRVIANMAGSERTGITTDTN